MRPHWRQKLSPFWRQTTTNIHAFCSHAFWNFDTSPHSWVVFTPRLSFFNENQNDEWKTNGVHPKINHFRIWRHVRIWQKELRLQQVQKHQFFFILSSINDNNQDLAIEYHISTKFFLSSIDDNNQYLAIEYHIFKAFLTPYHQITY